MKRFLTVLSICILSAILASCNSLNDSDSADVTVKTGISASGKSVSLGSPTNITSLVLNITGSGMDTITMEYSETIPSEITIKVPSGRNRLFELVAYTPSATLRGTSTKSVVGGATVNVPITMRLYETKIIIPDHNYYDSGNVNDNGRIVQINDYSDWSTDGYGWIERSATDLGIADFYPSDIDFDAKGRIYIASDNSNTPDIVRMDSIESTPEILLQSYSESGLYCIAINRNSSTLYVSDQTGIFIFDTDGNYKSSLILPADPAFNAIWGLAVDDEGVIYVSGQSYDGSNYYPIVWSLSSDEKTWMNYYISTGVNGLYASDVIYKNNQVYSSILDSWNSSGGSGQKVVQLNSSLEFQGELTGQGSYSFNGPYRFLAILNSRFYLMDEYIIGNETVIGFDDFSSDWDMYTGDGNFYFYEC